MAEEKFELYRYDPSLPAAIVFAILFLVTTSLHGYHMFRFRTWYWIPFVIGGTFQVLGYIFRAISARNPNTLGPYIGQSLLLLLAPALYAASVYMVLGRVIASLPHGPRYALIRPTWTTKLFVAGDVLSFLMQGGGGGILGTAKGDKDKVKMGENLVVGGLFVQLLFFGFFMVVACIFWRRYHAGEVVDKTRVAASPEGRWRALMKVLIGASLLILVRSVFRVVEYLGGNDGFLLRKEVFLYVFDSVLMVAVMGLFNWCFPGEVVGGESRTRKVGSGAEGGYAMTDSPFGSSSRV